MRMSSKAKSHFSGREIALIEQNPNVDYLIIYNEDDVMIKYKSDFIEHFKCAVLSGASPAKVFTEAGLPAKLIGYKRIERATYRWTKKGGR